MPTIKHHQRYVSVICITVTDNGEWHFPMTAVIGERYFPTTAVIGERYFTTTAIVGKR
jgi:hypothetical protein